MITTLDSALVRWSVVCRRWEDFSSGNSPQLGPFLAGWFMRDMGAPMPEDVGLFRESFCAGWAEADTEIEIASRQLTQS